MVYKITNLINGHIYIGAHSTHDISDNYLGSSKPLLSDVRMYGEEFFIREVLSLWPTAKEMFSEEERIVGLIFLKRKDIYNRGFGGLWIDGKYGRRPKNDEEYINDNNCEQDCCMISYLAPGLDENKKNIYLKLLQDIMVNYGSKVRNDSCNTERQHARNRIFVKHVVTLYYKVDGSFSEGEVENLERNISDRLGNFSRSIAISRKYLIPKIPLTYIICNNFCAWFVEQYYEHYQKGEFDSILHLNHIEKGSILYQFINHLIVDQKLIMEKYEPSEYLVTYGSYQYIGWFGKNNCEEYATNRENKKGKKHKS